MESGATRHPTHNMCRLKIWPEKKCSSNQKPNQRNTGKEIEVFNDRNKESNKRTRLWEGGSASENHE